MIHRLFPKALGDGPLHLSRDDVASLSNRSRITHGEALQHSAKLPFQLLQSGSYELLLYVL
jgi:hypothetical protein